MLVILNVSCDIAGLVGDTMLVSRSSAGCLVCIFENHCNLDGLVGDTTLGTSWSGNSGRYTMVFWML